MEPGSGTPKPYHSLGCTTSSPFEKATTTGFHFGCKQTAPTGPKPPENNKFKPHTKYKEERRKEGWKGEGREIKKGRREEERKKMLKSLQSEQKPAEAGGSLHLDEEIPIFITSSKEQGKPTSCGAADSRGAPSGSGLKNERMGFRVTMGTEE